MTRHDLLLSLTLWLGACGLGVGAEPECLTSDDCARGELCRLERCVPSGDPNASPTASVTVTTAPPEPLPTPPSTPTSTPTPPAPEPDAGPPADERADAGTPPTPACGPHPGPGDLALNELLVNVPPEPDGDANGDGRRDAYHDEFIELVNTTEDTLDLEGLTIANGDRVKYTAPGACLPPGAALVVFGGPGGAPHEETSFGLRAVADSRFGFSNTAGVVRVSDRFGRALVGLAYDDPPPTSYVLSPEISGDHYVTHPPPLMSPGTCADGSALAAGCAGAP